MSLDKIGFYTLSDKRALGITYNSRMKRCEMIINEYCNFKCPYCKGLDEEVFDDRRRKELTLEEMKRNIDLWCDNGPLENIRFSGGEPTYHRNIVEIVAYAKLKGINRIAISTNGSNKRGTYEKLIEAGCNDFSISLDAAESSTGDIMAGNIKGSWDKVVENIEWISKETYVTVGVVLEPENVTNFIDIVEYASTLGVSDIRVIPSAQWDQPLTELTNISQEVLDKHPILTYRVSNFIAGKRIRGLTPDSAKCCPIVLDDSIIAGRFHFPCVIYMREQGAPIGKVSRNMREERIAWFEKTNPHHDFICRSNCLDACVDHNKKAEEVLMK
ncbi:MAG: radical SAM protein [Candidatus Peribacteraceae bacterium]|nr:radical SAM protein [Candidatus Peribacteraceae bacterium]